ncbi:hypothetical protein ACP4OV_002281 [Aristida adscensionis]
MVGGGGSSNGCSRKGWRREADGAGATTNMNIDVILINMSPSDKGGSYGGRNYGLIGLTCMAANMFAGWLWACLTWLAKMVTSGGSSSSPAEFRAYGEKQLKKAIEQTTIKVTSGIVHKGILLGRDKKVAIKIFENMQCDEKKNFIDTLEKLFPSGPQHDNIVKHLGYYCSSEGDGPFYLVSIMEEFDLGKIISAHFNIIKGIAHGVDHMHGKKILHLNLKPSNILLDSKKIPIAKINDFKTAVVLADLGEGISFTRENPPGTDEGLHMAPELITPTTVGPYGAQFFASDKSDVFSFGTLLFQIIGCVCTGKSHRNPKKWREEMMAKETDVILRDRVDPLGRIPETERDTVRRCLEIGKLCCAHDPAQRPSMMEVIELLDQ